MIKLIHISAYNFINISWFYTLLSQLETSVQLLELNSAMVFLYFNCKSQNNSDWSVTVYKKGNCLFDCSSKQLYIFYIFNKHLFRSYKSHEYTTAIHRKYYVICSCDNQNTLQWLVSNFNQFTHLKSQITHGFKWSNLCQVKLHVNSHVHLDIKIISKHWL